MSYREENGEVVLTMTPDDFQAILLALGGYTALVLDRPNESKRMFELLNRLCEGSPRYTPYKV